MSYTELLNDPNWYKRFSDLPYGQTYAVSLTLKQRIGDLKLDEVYLEDTVSHFFYKMNTAVYGNAVKRFKKRLMMFGCWERTDRYHVHLAIERPERLSHYEFTDLVRTNWRSTRWGYETDKIEAVYDFGGWVGYMQKRRTKPNGLLASLLI